MSRKFFSYSVREMRKEKFQLFYFDIEQNWNGTHKVLCMKYNVCYQAHTHKDTLSTRSQMKFIMKRPFHSLHRPFFSISLPRTRFVIIYRIEIRWGKFTALGKVRWTNTKIVTYFSYFFSVFWVLVAISMIWSTVCCFQKLLLHPSSTSSKKCRILAKYELAMYKLKCIGWQSD